MAVVTRQQHADDVIVSCSKVSYHTPRSVLRTIIDQDNLEALAHR
jgi:hypothetical protein